jgi:chitodextrinase
MNRRIIAVAATGALAVAAAVAGVVSALPAQAAPVMCEKFRTEPVSGGRYLVQTNLWGADTPQCIDVNQTGPGFTVTQSEANKPTNGAPAAYPSIYFGCHYANCSTNSGLPLQANTTAFNNISSTVSMSYPSAGIWDAAYDIWLDPTPRTDGQNTGAEIMIWLNFQGPIQPVGSQVATINLLGGTWQVWFGNIGWNVISYRRTSATSSLNFNLNSTFFADALARGYVQRAWYLTSMQAGFEPWQGGAGLAVSSFSVTTSGGGGDTQAPSTPGNLAASGTTSTSTNLSWNASTDNVGVTGYDILRAPGPSGGTFTQVGTSTTTSFTATGLTAATTYRFQARARDAAGNMSAVSNTVTVTTQSGGGDTQAPSAPGNLAAAGTTSTSTNLSWTGSTDNVGVTGYDVLRAPGASGGSFTQVGTSTTPGFTSTGLTASTTYRFQVRARDAAGNLSPVSNTVTVTTQSGGGGGGGCSVAMPVQSQWNVGYVIQATTTNTGTSTINGWTVTFTLPAGHAITGMWGATLTTSGQTVTAHGLSYNSTLGPNQVGSWGFQASRPNGNTALPSGATCTSP